MIFQGWDHFLFSHPQASCRSNDDVGQSVFVDVRGSLLSIHLEETVKTSLA